MTYSLRLDVQSTDGRWFCVTFDWFVVDDEASSYMLHVGRAGGRGLGQLGDRLSRFDGLSFETSDSPPPEGCEDTCFPTSAAGFGITGCTAC